MRRMYDSVTAAHIPSSAAMVAGYVDGQYAWTAADWARFPNAVKVRISVGANPRDAQVLDVETGDYSPANIVNGILAQRAKGLDPTAYVNLNNWPAVRQAFHARGVPEPHYWLAHYDGLAELPAGAVAKQYINPPGSGGHFDLSAVADFWPGVDGAHGAGGGTITPDMDAETKQMIIDTNARVLALLHALNGQPNAQGQTVHPTPMERIQASLTDIQNVVHAAAAGGVTLPPDLAAKLDAVHNDLGAIFKLT